MASWSARPHLSRPWASQTRAPETPWPSRKALESGGHAEHPAPVASQRTDVKPSRLGTCSKAKIMVPQAKDKAVAFVQGKIGDSPGSITFDFPSSLAA